MSLELLRKSNAWDARYDLPTCPTHNNPHIYIAFAFRLCPEMAQLQKQAEEYILSCEVVPGYITRWPGSDDTSHDELMGAAYIYQEFARRAVSFLAGNDNYYSLEKEPPEKADQSRFLFLMPFLRACAGLRVSTRSQILFAAHVLFSAFLVKPGHTSGILKIWLMAPKMRQFPICALALWIWAWRWKKRGFTPNSIFGRYYLREIPVFSQLAKDTYE